MRQSKPTQPDAQVLRDLHKDPVQAFLKLSYDAHSQYYNEYFLFALKQDSSLANQLMEMHWQNLLDGQDDQIDATKLAGLLTKFTGLTECQPLKTFISAKSLANMESLSAEQAKLMLNMGLDHTTTEVLKQKIVAHRQQVFEEVTVCCKEQQKIDDLVAQIPKGSTDQWALGPDQLNSIFADIQAQVAAGHLAVDSTETVHVNKKGKKVTGAKDPTEKRIAGETAKYSYLVTDEGEIIITPKRKDSFNLSFKAENVKFKGSFKKVENAIVLRLDEDNNFELKRQVLVHQTLDKQTQKKKSLAAKFAGEVRDDDSQAKLVKEDYFLVQRKPLVAADVIGMTETGCTSGYAFSQIKGFISMTFAQVMASQNNREPMGDIKVENIFSAGGEGGSCEIFDQRARSRTSMAAVTRKHSIPFTHDTQDSYACFFKQFSKKKQAAMSTEPPGLMPDFSYVDTYGMLQAFKDVTQKSTDLTADMISARGEIESILSGMCNVVEQKNAKLEIELAPLQPLYEKIRGLKEELQNQKQEEEEINRETNSVTPITGEGKESLLTIGTEKREGLERAIASQEQEIAKKKDDVLERTEIDFSRTGSEADLPLLHEVLCRKFKGSTGDDLAIGDALGGPRVFGIDLPNDKENFTQLDPIEVVQLQQIFTDKRIAHEFDPDNSRGVQGALKLIQQQAAQDHNDVHDDVHKRLTSMVTSIEDLLGDRQKSSWLKGKKHHPIYARQIVAEIFGHGEQCPHSVKVLSTDLYKKHISINHTELLDDLDEKIEILKKMTKEDVYKQSKEIVKQIVLSNVRPTS